ncbi:MAG: dTDP-4-dehydrorhamnose 3,5-epimerase family protein [Thermomicrobia bacterium]|nr:dTDP-4-dehydrorhamnose 3,5-epimerase family protein [Thermomicrobia bacterium]
MIEGVEVKKLATFADERGTLTEIVRNDDPFFPKFGQCYFSVSYPGVIRAWHYHKKQTDYFCCIKGMIKVPLYDDREGSPTRGEINEFFIGERNLAVVKIPIGVMHGFKVVGNEPAYLLNLPTEPYRRDDPDEYRVAFDAPEIPYDWAIKLH